MDYRTPSRVHFSDAPSGSAMRSGAGRGTLLDDDYVGAARVGSMSGGARGGMHLPAPSLVTTGVGGVGVGVGGFGSAAGVSGQNTSSGFGAASALGRSSRSTLSDALGVGRGYGGAYDGLNSYADTGAGAGTGMMRSGVVGGSGLSSFGFSGLPTSTTSNISATAAVPSSSSAYAYAYASPPGRDVPLGGSAFASSRTSAFGGGGGGGGLPPMTPAPSEGLRERSRVSPRTGLNLGKVVMRETPRDRDCCSRIMHWLFI
jgi:hypothetical protein